MNVYDFDNTIYDGESGIDCFLFLIRKNPSLIRYIPSVGAGYLKYRMGLISIEMAKERYIGIIEDVIKNLDNLEDVVREFWDKNIHKIKPLFRETFEKGDLILSASPEFAIKEVCGRLGVDNFIGTDLDPKTGKINFICYRENKVKAFKEKYPDISIENFYTDSYNDKCMMDIAEHVYMIKKNKVTKLR